MSYSEVFINLLIGLIGGIFSGIIVGEVYRRIEWKKQFSMDKQLLNRNIEAICYELTLLTEGKKKDLLYIQQLILDSPMTPTFGSKRIIKKNYTAPAQARNLLEELKTFFFNMQEYNDSYKNKLKVYNSQLFKLRLDIVSMSTKRAAK